MFGTEPVEFMLMLSSGRNDLKNIPILEDTIKLPISVLFIFSPEIKGAQQCSEKQLKIIGGSGANQTTPNSLLHLSWGWVQSFSKWEWLHTISSLQKQQLQEPHPVLITETKGFCNGEKAFRHVFNRPYNMVVG